MKRVWILNDLYVLPQARNSGIAKASIDAAKDFAIKTNAARIIWVTEVTYGWAKSLRINGIS